MTNLIDFKTWIITEGMAGTENQCLGVAEALGVSPEIKRINLNQPWKILSPYLGFEQSFTFSPTLEGPWPDLLISSGRKAIAAARYIKRQSKGKTFTLHIQDPRISPNHFDLLAVPAHDPARGENVIVTMASPNRITKEKLDKAREEFITFEALPAPRVAVLIGGSSKAYTLTPAIMETLSKQLKTLADQGVSLMITASRRTGAENEKILRDVLFPSPEGGELNKKFPLPQGGGLYKKSPSLKGGGQGEGVRISGDIQHPHLNPPPQGGGNQIYIWNGEGANPYFGMLAWADTILVTADSASMLSEACTTGKPVYMIKLEGGAPRIAKLHENLMAHSALRVFDGALESWNYAALNDSGKIADELRRKLKIKN